MADPDPLRIPVPLRSGRNRRVADRVPALMPVSVDGVPGTTQDVSSTGLSFLADHAYTIGSRVGVLIDYLLDGANYPLECQAEVMRVERTDEGYLIGARLLPQEEMQDVAVPAGTDASMRHLRPIE